jgi:CRISPR-associated protein Cas6
MKLKSSSLASPKTPALRPNAMPILDLSFPIIGTQPIPADHGYHLYSALSHALPVMHQHNGIAVHPIRGTQIGNRMLQLTDQSAIVLRVVVAGAARR